jgi:hypothetical protein
MESLFAFGHQCMQAIVLALQLLRQMRYVGASLSGHGLAPFFQEPRGRPHPERTGDFPPWKSASFEAASCIESRFMMFFTFSFFVFSLGLRPPRLPAFLPALYLLAFFLAIVFSFLVRS